MDVAVADTLVCSVKKEELLPKISSMSSIVDRRGLVPSFSNIRIEVCDGNLQLIAMNMDVSAVDTIELEGDYCNGVSFAVCGWMFCEICRKVSDGSVINIYIESSGDVVAICFAETKFTLPVAELSERIATNLGDNLSTLCFAASTFKDLFHRSVLAIADSDNKYNFNGLYLHRPQSNLLRVVATDGHRLAYSEINVENCEDNEPSLLPKRIVHEILKRIGKAEDEVTISIGERQCCFAVRNSSIYSGLMRAKFPDYQSLVGKALSFNKVFSVFASDIVSALSRVALINSDNKIRAVKMCIECLGDNKGGLIKFSANSAAYGAACEVVRSVQSKDEILINAMVNADYLMDALSGFGDSHVTIGMNSATDPLVIKQIEKSSALLHLIMPMRVSSMNDF